MPGSDIALRRLLLRSLRSTDRSIHLVLDPARLTLSVPQASAILVRERPAAIFTTGGYVAIPVLLAASSLRIPVVMWEGNVIPGRSVRATARLADAVAVSYGATCAALNVRAGRCFETGTPIRDLAGIDPLAARARFGIPAGDRLLLIFGGSQAVRRFNAAVAGALARLVERVHVVHVTGEPATRPPWPAGKRCRPTLRDRYRPYPFLRDEMTDALVAADLIVGRAGSSTLAEATALGRPLVIVPYPHAAGHQQANARPLVEAGAARLIDDEDSMPRPSSMPPRSSTTRPPTTRWPPPRAPWAGRPRRPRWPSSSSRAAERRAFPEPAAVLRRSRGELAG